MFNEELNKLANMIAQYCKGQVHLEYNEKRDDLYITLSVLGRKPFTYTQKAFGSVLCYQNDALNRIVVKLLSTYRKHILAYYFKEQVPASSVK